MKNTYKLGQEVKFTKGFELTSEISKTTLQVNEGDKAIITRSGFKIANGEARGKILIFNQDEQVKGHDYTNIARLIYQRLNNAFLIEPILEDDGYEVKDILGEIEDVLMDIL